MEQQTTQGTELGLQTVTGRTDIRFSAAILVFGRFEVIHKLGLTFECFGTKSTWKKSIFIRVDLHWRGREEYILPYEQAHQVAMPAKFSVNIC